MLSLLRMLKRYRYHLPVANSPTFYNIAEVLHELGWKSSSALHQSHFNSSHFQFDEHAANTLEHKHRLASLMQAGALSAMPETYALNDFNWLAVIDNIAKQYYTKNESSVDVLPNVVWILKPSLLNNGQEIKIFTHLSQLQQYYLRSNRLGGEHVLQKYIVHPDLMQGCKYSIRVFVVITNYDGAYLYPEGYYNVARLPYSANDFSDLRPHLTNEHLSHEAANVTQIPSRQCANFHQVYPQIKTCIQSLLQHLQHALPGAFVCQRQRTFAIFGFDFMLDRLQQLWLLEANHGPCFPISDTHPLQPILYEPFWRACVDCFVLPIALRTAIKKLRYAPFERVLGPS